MRRWRPLRPPPNLSPDASTFSVASSAQAVREHLQAHAADFAACGASRSSALIDMAQAGRDAPRDGARYARDTNVNRHGTVQACVAVVSCTLDA